MKCIWGEVLQHSLSISEALRRTGARILTQWTKHPQRITAETKPGCCVKAPTEASGNCNCGFEPFSERHTLQRSDSAPPDSGRMHDERLTCVIPLQLHVLHRHVSGSPKGVKNLQGYDDTNHNQILNITFATLVFT